MKHPLPLEFSLQPAAPWGHKAGKPLSKAKATLWVEAEALRMRWEVIDHPASYRCAVEEDGGPVWQDSCVELFIMALDQSGDYCNFEFNSQGLCLSARGPDRHHRRPLGEQEYAVIQRELIPLSTQPEPWLGWTLEVRIPRELLGSNEDLRKQDLLGNIYKCADLAVSPHYLSAFPIATERPDFHRPEFFRVLYKSAL